MLAGFTVLVAYPNLPSIESVTDYRPKVPLRVYTADGVLIGEFGEERRAVVSIDEVPEVMKHAILAAEDERFYHHQGVDYVGVVRAAYSNLITGGRRQGASTITMQVARNFFLSSEKTLTRKLYEALLAFKIEANLTKDHILEIYVNQIYLGQRAYGFAAAARVYFGKPLSQISVAEAAMLAGLPKAPSSYNPIANPKRAKQRQLYVLRRMRELGYITDQQFTEAQKAPIVVKHEMNDYAIHAEYVAEMVRQSLLERFPDDLYTKGYRVYTTITRADQEAAYDALRSGLLEYDRRQGYRGAEGYAKLPADDSEEAFEEALQDASDSDDLRVALVLDASQKQVKAYLHGGETVTITGEGLRFASRMISDRAPANRRIRRGAIIRVQQDAKGAWSITQLPEAEAALVSVDPNTGAVRSLVGGFDFSRSKFNHVTQAWRQPGSSFKPFIYSAALEKGFTPASVINDAPIVVDAALTGGQVWEPKNYDDDYEGPMRLRMALVKSKNMVSIRLLQAIGATYARDYTTRFGFEPEKQPPYLTLALGAGSVTPMEMARAYSVFANQGYFIEPYLIGRVVNDQGDLISEVQPQHAGNENQRVLDPRNDFIMNNMMQDVTRFGTAAQATSLGRRDIAGKTGTTNDHVDAWFAGYQRTLVAIAWVGFDQPHSLGPNETGAAAALPIWIRYMGKALKNVPQADMPMPPGIVSAKIDAATGLATDTGTITEYFYREHPPAEQAVSDSGTTPEATESVKNQLF